MRRHIEKMTLTEDQIMAAIGNSRGLCSIGDIESHYAQKHPQWAENTEVEKRRWSGQQSVNRRYINEAALRVSLSEMAHYGKVVRVRGSDLKIRHYGVSPVAWYFFSPEGWAKEKAAEEQQEQERAEAAARVQAEKAVLEKYSDEVDQLTAILLAEGVRKGDLHLGSE